MLSSIHPLGERSRNNRWAVTMTAFTLGSVLTATAFGAVLGLIGAGLPIWPGLVAAAIAGALDLAGVKAPGPERQVNERWIDTYRGTVYGFGFGAQLGAGVMTYVVTWGVYAVFIIELTAGSALLGAAIGAAFGVGRTVAPLASGWVDRPSRLTSMHIRLAELARPVHLGAGFVLLVAGVIGSVV